MLSKNQIKLITQLKNKKYRNEQQLFVVEGLKSVNEFIAAKHFECVQLYTTQPELFTIANELITPISTKELQRISNLKHPNTCLTVFKIPKNQDSTVNKGLKLVLDGISDPGNLGTIIRLCDWFGVETLYCSTDTVDCYNPKVVQATMGSLNRVNIVYTDIKQLLVNESVLTYGAFMDGENIYKTALDKNAFLVIGNEANGISPEIDSVITNRITIPKFGARKQTESLNAAIATGILLSEFYRN